MDLYPGLAAKIFGIHEPSNGLYILREKQNIDFTLRTPNECVVIEVKFKDIVTRKQLERYVPRAEKIAGNRRLTCIVLSLSDVRPDVLEGTRWQSISFRDVANALSGFCAEDLVAPNHRVLMLEYVDMIEAALGFLRTVSDALESPPFCWRPYHRDPQVARKIAEALISCRMHSAVDKGRAKFSRLALETEADGRAIIPHAAKHNLSVGFEDGYTNATPLVGMWVRRNMLCLGLQVQGRQYRRFILLDQGVITPSMLEDPNAFDWLFARKFEKGAIQIQHGGGSLRGGYRTNMRPSSPIKKYVNRFVYQYVDIGAQSKSLDPMNVVNAVVQDAEYAIELLARPEFLKEWDGSRATS